jgi:hypothetical protein
MYGRLMVCIYINQYSIGSLSRLCFITSKGSKQRYFIYCPKDEIFIISIFPFNAGLQINLHPNLSDYIWSDRICDYMDGIAKDSLITGYELSRLQIKNFPTIIETIDNLIQLSRTSPELGDACAGVWGKNCFPRHIPYQCGYDSLFI